MKLLSVQEWNREFFEKFLALRGDIFHQNLFLQRHDLGEKLNDLEAVFGKNANFAKHNKWAAAIVADSSGKALGRVALTLPNGWTKFAPLGWFECHNDAKVAELLFGWCEGRASEWGVSELRGPINGNFFRTYRLRLPGGGEPFYGEPLCPDYYHDLFRKCGFEVSGKWATVENWVGENLDFTAKVRDRVLSRSTVKLNIREIQPSNWGQDLDLIHKMLSDSFSLMPDFMPISQEEFRELYDSFKHLIIPELNFILEADGEPVAFMIAYFDPLPILKEAEVSPWPWRSLVALWKLRRNRKRLLIPYVGKIQGRRDVAGVIGVLGHELLERVKKYGDSFLACYVADGSKTFGGMTKDFKTVAEYVLYRKQL